MNEKVYRTELTPVSFLQRSVSVFPDKIAVVHGDRQYTYSEFGARVNRFAAQLRENGLRRHDRVAVLSPNTPALLEAHFAVPAAGGILVAINTRLQSQEVDVILKHAGPKFLFVDAELAPLLEPLNTAGMQVVRIEDTGSDTDPYEQFLSAGNPHPVVSWLEDEEETISINYTSGTTGRPKGVMYTHRGAYLNALGEVVHSKHSSDSVYLWTLPMFHCNGWCTTWAVTAVGGRHVCLRAVEPSRVWQLMRDEGVTHLNGAPTVLISLANAPEAAPLGRPLTITTAGAPPSPTIIEQMTELGARIVHVYGLTETYGPYTVCERQSDWDAFAAGDRARRLARQGVAYVIADPVRVVDPDMRDVPRDGATMGEVVMRGNNVMAGYFGDPEATEAAFTGGWFHSGDLAVWHPDGYIELRDRAKDVIISGGENISTIEVEQAIASHPAVMEAAVVAMPHDHWGERPKAVVVVKPGTSVTAEELIAHVHGRIARFKAPDAIDFVDALPKTSTGKIQKYVLREKEWARHSSRIH